MEVAKQKKNWQEDQLIFFAFLHIVLLTFLVDLYYSVSALCKWTEVFGNCLFYEMKYSK